MKRFWRSRQFKRQTKHIHESARRHKTPIVVIGVWVVMQIASTFVTDLAYAIPWLSWVYRTGSRFAPPLNANPIWNFAYANLLFWPLVGTALLIHNVWYWIFQRQRVTREIYQPISMYREELAAALVAVDTQRDEKEVTVAVEELVDTIFDTVAAKLGLVWKECRMYLVVPQTVHQDETILSGFRKGKFFEDVRRGRVSPVTLEEVLKQDSKFANVFQKEADKTETYVDLKDRKEKVLLFSTNPGQHLRMGLFVVVTREDAKSEDFEEMFPKVTQIISTIGFIDDIVEVVRQYGQDKLSEGGDANGR